MAKVEVSKAGLLRLVISANLQSAGGRHGGTMTYKGVYKERLLQVVLAATQVAISRRVQRYKLALHGRQEVEDQRTGSTSMIWGCSVDAQ